MGKMIRNLTRRLNEASGSIAPRIVLNTLLQGKAKVLNLQIDSKAKTIDAEVLPQGQRQPLKLRIEGYQIEEDGQHTKLSWSSIHIEAGAVDLPPGLKSKLEFIL
jgi:hypothetical protein